MEMGAALIAFDTPDSTSAANHGSAVYHAPGKLHLFGHHRRVETLGRRKRRVDLRISAGLGNGVRRRHIDLRKIESPGERQHWIHTGIEPAVGGVSRDVFARGRRFARTADLFHRTPDLFPRGRRECASQRERGTWDAHGIAYRARSDRSRGEPAP